MLSILYVIT